MKKWIAALLSASCFLLLPGTAFAAETKAPGTTAKAYILIEAGTGRTLAAQNEREKLPIASTTKILTALLALEQPELDQKFQVDSLAIRTEGSTMGLREGDFASLRDLAAGMLLPSGNDAANAAAVRIDGSIEEFAQRMNRKAEEIGMADSHFVTPSGLPHDEHYSTATDMALLARLALQNQDFAAICGKSSIRLEFGNPPYSRSLKNHNRLVSSYEGCIGMKTGFTKKAGRCLVSAAKRNGVTLICVTLNDPNDWKDHASLLDWGFSQVSLRELSPDTEGLRLPIAGSLTESLPVRPLGRTFAAVTPEQEPELEQEVYLPRFVYAPVQPGDLAGEIRWKYQGSVVAVTLLTAEGSAPVQEKAPKKGFWQKWKDFWGKYLRI